MESTTIANVDARTAFDATPAAPCRSALVRGRGHASTPVMTTGGVRLHAPAAQLRGGVEAYRFRGRKGITAGSAPRTTVPSSGTSPTSPPV